MVDNLNELNRLLVSLRELSPNKQRVPVSVLTRHLRARVFLGVNPKFEPIIEFAVQLGLASSTRKGVALTQIGRDLLEENPEEFYELRPRQCALLMRKCYLDGTLRSEMKRLVAKFESENDLKPIAWSALDSEPLGDTEWLAEHLLQLGVLARKDELLVVAEEYRTTFMQFCDEGGDFTAEQHEQYLKEKRLLADIAESFVVKYEQNRLHNAGHTAESACIKKISKTRVHAGYDINSFDGQSKGLAHDRFIEVKGSGQANLRFIWSPNEMEKAKELGNKYWIYFVGQIDKKYSLVHRAPVLIQNPHVRLQTDSQFKSQPQTMLVQAVLSGAALKPAVKIRNYKK
jgi:hypothetical protein